MLYLTNPWAKRKVLSLTKAKGKIYKTKSLGHYITHLYVHFSAYHCNMFLIIYLSIYLSLIIYIYRSGHICSLSIFQYNSLSVIWKSDLTDKMSRSFFQAAIVLILLYGCTIWTLTKRLEKKLDGNYTRMFRAILNKSWRQHPTRHQLYGHLPPITKTIQVRRTRHAGLC